MDIAERSKDSDGVGEVIRGFSWIANEEIEESKFLRLPDSSSNQSISGSPE